MADMSVAAARSLNWNVMTVFAKNIEECRNKLEAGDYARNSDVTIAIIVTATGEEHRRHGARLGYRRPARSWISTSRSAVRRALPASSRSDSVTKRNDRGIL